MAVPGASSTIATICRRDATRASAWKAGRCAERAMPPKPNSTPRYTRRSGELCMEFRLALMREDETDQHEIERPHDDPAVDRRPTRDDDQRQQQEADVLRDPRTSSHDRALMSRPGPRQDRRHGAALE